MVCEITIAFSLRWPHQPRSHATRHTVRPPPPAPRQGPKRSRDQVSGGPASPPATSRKPKAVRIESPPAALMHSSYATGSPLRNEGSSTNTKTNESLPAKIEKPKKEDREKGWTTVERKRRGGRPKGVRKAEIVDGRGVTTFWSTPDGLYESWRPGRRETRGKPRRERQ